MRVPFAALLTLLSATSAFAHVFPDHAEPRVGSHVTQSPPEVKLWFDRKFDPSGTTMQVFDSSDNEVDLKDSHADATDATLLIVSLPSLPSGTYSVHWHALALEGHQTQGDFKFTIDISNP